MTKLKGVLNIVRYDLELSPQEVEVFKRILENTVFPTTAVVQKDEQIMAQELLCKITDINYTYTKPIEK